MLPKVCVYKTVIIFAKNIEFYLYIQLVFKYQKLPAKM